MMKSLSNLLPSVLFIALFASRSHAQDPAPSAEPSLTAPSDPDGPAAEAAPEVAPAPTSEVPEAEPAPDARARAATAPSLTVAPPQPPQVASAASATPPAQVVSMGPKGLTVQSEDAKYVFNIRFPFMFDYKATLSEAQPRPGDAFQPRFFGPIFTVTLHKAVTGKLIVGFQNRAVTVVNAWLDVAAHTLLHLRLGKFLYPIALERQTLPLRIVMLEHGIASQLLPVSEFGAQLWGTVPDRLFEYQLTVGNGGYANQHYEVDLDKGKDLIGRVYFRPFVRTGIAALKGFGFGFGGAWGIHRGQSGNALTGSPSTLGGRAFFNTRVSANPADPSGTVFASGPVVRLVPQLSYTAGPVSLYAEYIRVTEDLRLDTRRKTFTHQSAHAVLSVALTGEDEVLLDIITPKRPFDLSAGHFGALELVGNIETLQFDKELFPDFADPTRSAQKALAFGGGLNWIPTELIRVMVNYEHTRFATAENAPKPRSENLLGARVQALF